MAAAVPLWSDLNHTLYSSILVVPPGQSVVLFATGLSEEKVRKSAAEFKGPQMACVEKLIYTYDGPELVPACDGLCNPWVYEMKPMTADLKAVDYVETCSLPWTLEPCRNIGIIGIPGTYRLRLNDATAVGTAQVWAEWHLNESIASQVYGAYFA